MDKVNIYITTDFHGVRAANVSYGFVLELKIRGTLYTKERFGMIENVTANRAELMIMLAAMEMLRKPCELTIYSKSAYLASGLNEVKAWQGNGWKTSSGKEPANRDVWEQIYKQIDLRRHECEVKIGKLHEYSKWLTEAIEKHKKEVRIHGK